jgi:ERCC4-related helicase
VPLAAQQAEVLQQHISSVQLRLITGADNVDSWSEQRVWDDILLNIRIVVSTYQILFDAISHGFVRLDSLSLIVLDEGSSTVAVLYFSLPLSLSPPLTNTCIYPCVWMFEY